MLTNPKNITRILMLISAIGLWESSSLAGNISCEYLREKSKNAYFSLSPMNDSSNIANQSEILNEDLAGVYLQPSNAKNGYVVHRFGNELMQAFPGVLEVSLQRRPGSKHDRCQMSWTVRQVTESGPKVHQEMFEVIALDHGGGDVVQTLWIGQRDEEGGEIFYVLERESVPQGGG